MHEWDQKQREILASEGIEVMYDIVHLLMAIVLLITVYRWKTFWEDLRKDPKNWRRCSSENFKRILKDIATLLKVVFICLTVMEIPDLYNR
jgi:uncharacterized membrane protein